MCYVTLVSVLIEESRGPKHNRLVLCKALHPCSFHFCQPQDPSHVFVLPSLLALCVRLGAHPLVFVCPRKLLKERATYQGVTRPACELSLSYLSHFWLWSLREVIPLDVVVEFVIKLSSEVRFNFSDITFNSYLNLSGSDDRI
jgi:hypothetical protein